MKALDQYLKLQQEIFEYFGYKEDWVAIPIDDQRDKYWFVRGEGPGCYCYSPKPFTKRSIKEGKNIYGGSIYTQRFLPKWVYRGKDYTMVCADTHTDGNKFLMIFSNDKECKDEELINSYHSLWSHV